MAKRKLIDETQAEEVSYETITGVTGDVISSLNCVPLSLTDEKKAKEQLQIARKNVVYELDKRKLVLTDPVMQTVEKNVYKLTTADVPIETADDVVKMANATEKLLKIMQMMRRIESVDGEGTAGRINVSIELENQDGDRTIFV